MEKKKVDNFLPIHQVLQLYAYLFRYLEEDDENDAVCTDLEEAYEFLINLWVVGHATWVQAYTIKNKNGNVYENFADKKMEEAQSMIQTFTDKKENIKPAYCHCFEEGTYYQDFNHWLNPNKTMSFSATSASGCQKECNSQEDCKVWTFIQHKTLCLTFDENAIQTTIADESHPKKDIISGPKICLSHFTFCCGLGYGASVTITFFIVLFSTILCCCCCIIICGH